MTRMLELELELAGGRRVQTLHLLVLWLSRQRLHVAPETRNSKRSHSPAG